MFVYDHVSGFAVFDVVLLIVLRAKAIDEYAKYLAFDIVAGLMPLTFISLAGSVDITGDGHAAVSLLVLLGLLVFARRQLFSEFGKQFSPDCLVRSIARLRWKP